MTQPRDLDDACGSGADRSGGANATLRLLGARAARLRYLDEDRTDFDRGQLRAEFRGVLLYPFLGAGPE